MASVDLLNPKKFTPETIFQKSPAWLQPFLQTGPNLVLNHFIDGQFVSSDPKETFENRNPATGEIISQVALGNAETIHQAAEGAQKAFDSAIWSNLALKERAVVVKRLGDLLLENLETFAFAETMDTGKPIRETLEGDIPRSAQNCHFFADYAQSLVNESYCNGQHEQHWVSREPLGVVGLITPWNLPLYLATWKIAPALMMGNSVILKPAEWTPYTATLFAALSKEAGLPDGVFQVVHGFGADSAGEALTRHPLVKSISFTGETGTGRAIMAACAPTLKKVSFELGGKGASVIFEDADLSKAIPTSLRAAFRNQGQICLAGSRLFVHQSRLNEVTEAVLNHVKTLKVGNPLLPETDMGALVHPEHFEKVQHYVHLAKSQGEWLWGGERLDSPLGACLMQPGVFTQKPGQTDFALTQVCQEEIFGPVLPLIPFETEEEVIAWVNSTPYGLSASIWSQDVNRCHRVSQKIKTGLVWVNCWFVRDLRTPFGGQKASGIGREGGRYSLEFFSETKTVSYLYS
jgi:aminomuconate-semialdehyde/2-hydroxymuconate-6-semialdehyde dehydrogenase